MLIFGHTQWTLVLYSTCTQAGVILKLNKTKGKHIGNEEVELSLFEDYMIVNKSEPKDSIRIFIYLVNSTIATYKINTQSEYSLFIKIANVLRSKQ